MGALKKVEDILAGAKAKNQNVSDAALWDHKMSHGHCTKTKY